MSLLQVLHWFNPLVWLAFYRMQTDRELACDALVLTRTRSGESKEYGRTIVNLLKRFSRPQRLPSMAGILETKSQLKRRIKMITQFKKTSRPQWAGAMLLLAVLTCVVLTNAYVAKADFEFGTPINLGPAINDAGWNGAICISPDGLEFYFGSEDGNIWIARRATVNSEWEPALNLDPIVNSSAGDGGPCISPDGLSLYFVSDRPGGFGQLDIWMTTRVTVDDDWDFPENLGASINSAFWDWGQSLSADELQLYFTSNRPGGFGDHDMYVASRAAKDEPWGEPINLGSTLNSSVREEFPHISADGLLLFFGSNRPGGYGSYDLWVSRRQTINDPWDPPVNLGPMVNSIAGESAPVISPDGSILYFHSDRPGGFGSWDAWQIKILPVVDLNSDGIVDAADMCIIIDYWGTDEPLCDIGPMPWGDGIVDVQDLIVIAEHLTKDKDVVAPNDVVDPIVSFIVIDDFENYNRGENQIWYAWHDGWGYGKPGEEHYFAGNRTGSMVGDDKTASFTEETIVHGGSQAMPVFYDNNRSGRHKYSEVIKALTYPIDWTEGNLDTLTIWFHGDPANTPEWMYVCLSNIAVVYNDNPNATLVEDWTEWNIDLQEFADLDVDLTNVNSIAIGFGDRYNPQAGGEGKMYFDDIQLNRSPSDLEPQP